MVLEELFRFGAVVIGTMAGVVSVVGEAVVSSAVGTFDLLLVLTPVPAGRAWWWVFPPWVMSRLVAKPASLPRGAGVTAMTVLVWETVQTVTGRSQCPVVDPL